MPSALTVFFAGLGAGLIIGIYDYPGYNMTAYMGAEMRSPGRVVPYNAARDGVFLRQFGRLHPRYHFPDVAVIVMCVITAVSSILPLGTIIAMLTAVIVIVQSLGQVAALTILRRRQPNLNRPYRMWLYSLFSIIALIGWVYVFVASGLSGTQFILPIWTNPMLLAVGWTVLGIVAYLLWARFVEHT